MHVLIFTGGQAPLPRDTTFYFAHAPKVDYVIAADAGLDTLESYRHFYDGNYDFSQCMPIIFPEHFELTFSTTPITEYKNY